MGAMGVTEAVIGKILVHISNSMDYSTVNLYRRGYGGNGGYGGYGLIFG